MQKRMRIRRKIRSRVFGTIQCPRFSVFRSNKYMSAQIIDDKKGVTIAGARDKSAETVGTQIATAAIKAGIKKIVFDRGSYQYHGRVKQLADAARKAGLKF